MDEPMLPAMMAPARLEVGRWRRPFRPGPGLAGVVFLALMLAACVGTLPWTLARTAGEAGIAGSPRYDDQDRAARQLPPGWWPADPDQAARLREVARRRAARDPAVVGGAASGPLEASAPFYLTGTDLLGRSLTVRLLAGGGISLGIGLAAATLSVVVGTLYGAVSGYAGGRVDAVMMRIVDVLYGLPYILLVVLLAVAVDARVDAMQSARVKEATRLRSIDVEGRVRDAERTGGGTVDEPARAALRARFQRDALGRYGTGELGAGTRQAIGLFTLLIAIGGVSWLTMARVVRGQVLSLKAQPFMEAARAIGVPLHGQLLRHLLPNLVGPIVVYATLTVPQAILQESFLSFLGIGVKAPLPSWGNLAAEGLVELNPYKSNWWLLAFPCATLGMTLLALNFVGEALREALDPKRRA